MKKPRFITRRGTGDWFSDLSLPLQKQAQWEYQRLCARWEFQLTQWRKAILVGRARWIVKHPECRTPEWGRKLRRNLLAKWGRERWTPNTATLPRDGENWPLPSRHPCRKGFCLAEEIPKAEGTQARVSPPRCPARTPRRFRQFGRDIIFTPTPLYPLHALRGSAKILCGHQVDAIARSRLSDAGGPHVRPDAPYWAAIASGHSKGQPESGDTLRRWLAENGRLLRHVASGCTDRPEPESFILCERQTGPENCAQFCAHSVSIRRKTPRNW